MIKKSTEAKQKMTQMLELLGRNFKAVIKCSNKLSHMLLNQVGGKKQKTLENIYIRYKEEPTGNFII